MSGTSTTIKRPAIIAHSSALMGAARYIYDRLQRQPSVALAVWNDSEHIRCARADAERVERGDELWARVGTYTSDITFNEILEDLR